jgi:hypothetical protein
LRGPAIPGNTNAPPHHHGRLCGRLAGSLPAWAADIIRVVEVLGFLRQRLPHRDCLEREILLEPDKIRVAVGYLLSLSKEIQRLEYQRLMLEVEPLDGILGNQGNFTICQKAEILPRVGDTNAMGGTNGGHATKKGLSALSVLRLTACIYWSG